MDQPFFDQAVETGGVWLWGVGVLAGAALVGLLVHAILLYGARRLLRHTEDSWSLWDALDRRLSGPLRLLVPALFTFVALPGVRGTLPAEVVLLLDGGLHVTLVAATAWLIVATLFAGEEVVATHYTLDTPDNLQARKIVTQVRILRRIATAVVVVLAIGAMLLRYEPFRELGTGLLASAGIVGIVVGIAAQRTLSDVIAGIQIALTQPIRVDDVVIVEGEFGWVEEITLTYVVVRVWDRRRIVMPITHFIENPFQNWTRTSSDLIGSVFLYVDHRTPVPAVREELQRVVEASEYWDGDACALHVTDTSERAVELRAIASAQSAPQLWELRCEIREALVEYLQTEHPEALPRLRAHVEPTQGDGAGAFSATSDPT
jgi:small-conductance mechanosensitive channel